MSDSYTYEEVPKQLAPVVPAFAQAPLLPHSDSQTTLYSQSSSRSYADTFIRGNADDDLDKTDIFWRRFNASAQQQQLPDAEKSSWLEKTEGKSSRSRRWIWIVGLLLVLLAAGGIGIGVFISFHDSSNTSRPDTIGGAADVGGSPGAVAATAAVGGTVGAVATSSSLHVSPTNTVP